MYLIFNKNSAERALRARIIRSTTTDAIGLAHRRYESLQVDIRNLSVSSKTNRSDASASSLAFLYRKDVRWSTLADRQSRWNRDVIQRQQQFVNAARH